MVKGLPISAMVIHHWLLFISHGESISLILQQMSSRHWAERLFNCFSFWADVGSLCNISEEVLLLGDSEHENGSKNGRNILACHNLCFCPGKPEGFRLARKSMKVRPPHFTKKLSHHPGSSSEVTQWRGRLLRENRKAGANLTAEGSRI